MTMLHFLFLAAFLQAVSANDDSSTWTSPRANSIWTAGTTQTVSWTTNYTAAYPVNLWQQWPQGGGANDLGTIYLASAGSTGAQSFSWVVDYRGADLSYSNYFFIWANQNGSSAWSAWNSGYFNITAAPAIVGATVTKSSTSSTTPTPTPTGQTLSSTAASATSSGIGQPSDSPSASRGATLSSSTAESDGSTSNSSVIGIGVGVGVGVAVVIIAAVVAFFLLRKRRRARAVAGALPAHPSHHSRGLSELPTNSLAYEADTQQISEMPGRDYGAYGYQDSKTASKWVSPVYEAPGSRPHAAEME